ncbi:MAG: type II toxin-antitoxin system VapB family antitoxin [Candidatus Margulisbacteria bacterium]|jgi:antitoxin VapB|nr:type II toxin-antitoxin system VapB family antitoxin [Candidatus Margulisiibacteriota bacterium]
MKTTKVFKSGNSLAVRLPKGYQVADKELYIRKIGSSLLLMPRKKPWELLKKSLGGFSADFFADGREQPAGQKRHRL